MRCRSWKWSGKLPWGWHSNPHWPCISFVEGLHRITQRIDVKWCERLKDVGKRLSKVKPWWPYQIVYWWAYGHGRLSGQRRRKRSALKRRRQAMPAYAWGVYTVSWQVWQVMSCSKRMRHACLFRTCGHADIWWHTSDIFERINSNCFETVNDQVTHFTSWCCPNRERSNPELQSRSTAFGYV